MTLRLCVQASSLRSFPTLMLILTPWLTSIPTQTRASPCPKSTSVIGAMRLRSDHYHSSCCRNVADDDPVRTDANALRDYLRDGGRHTGERDTLAGRYGVLAHRAHSRHASSPLSGISSTAFLEPLGVTHWYSASVCHTLRSSASHPASCFEAVQLSAAGHQPQICCLVSSLIPLVRRAETAYPKWNAVTQVLLFPII